MRFRVAIDKERCKGCALCIHACAQAVLKMARKLNAAGYQYAEVEDPDDCTGCKACAEVCPDVAIEITREDTGTDVDTPAAETVAQATAVESSDDLTRDMGDDVLERAIAETDGVPIEESF